MTGLAASQSTQERNAVAPLLVWLVACTLMTWLSAHAIATRSFPDPDDIMRLLEVRDWMGGQSWFDVGQYRLNGAAGVPMHWSRLVDVPIAGVILATRPFLGADRAETTAIVIVPLLTLGLAMLLVHRIALKLMTSRAALVAVAATPLSLGAMKQMRPMRIDHHGWQIVMALLGLLACFDQRPRRSGIVAGIAMALWLNISLEGLPFAAAIGALFAFEWLRDGSAAQRLEAYVGALAVSSFVVFGATHLPSAWMSQGHDVVTAAYLAGFAAASLSIFAVVRRRFEHWPMRLAALAVVGVVTLSAMFVVDVHWMSGPFSNLDPLVRELWYLKDDEGLPMWQVDWSEAAMGLAQPIVGLIGASVALAYRRDGDRARWAIYLFLLLALTVSSMFLLRVSTTASVVAMPATAFLCQFAYRRARSQNMLLMRIVSTAAALLVMTPAYALPASVSTPDSRVDSAVLAENNCAATSQVSKLADLPPGEIVAPLDVTPAILLHTAHRALATGHHRNVTGMRDTIRLFLERPASGVEIIKRRRVDYVVLCPGAPEAIRYARHGPDGLAAMLVANRPPNWLELAPIPGLKTLKVWRVRKELL